MLKDRSSALVVLAIIAVASGCSHGGTDSGVKVSQTAGVTIQEFSASPAKIYDGQPVSVQLRLKNSGGRQASDVRARIYNMAFKGDRSWTIVSGSRVKDYNTLRPANPGTDTPAQTVRRVWRLKAPQLEGDLKIPYTLNTRVFYRYSTRGVTDITVMTGEEFRNSNVGKSQPKLDNTGGPIQLGVRTLSPIVFYENSDSIKSQFCVIAENVGSGTPFLPGASYDRASDRQNKRKINVSVRASGTTVSFEKTEKTVNIIGKEGQTCFTMKANSLSSGAIQETVPITLTAEYGYFVDERTSLTVNGAR
ncbi:MAG: hypothetical protein ABEJ98_00045 [Candidatus Nanohaloarchaea archaeon]